MRVGAVVGSDDGRFKIHDIVLELGLFGSSGIVREVELMSVMGKKKTKDLE